MREIEIEGEKIRVRGLKRKEIREKLAPYGYTPTLFSPKKNEAGEVDLALLDEGRNVILEIVMATTDIDKLEGLDGNRACNSVINAIINETYPSRAEEKNSSGSGDGAGHQNATEPAPPAIPCVPDGE